MASAVRFEWHITLAQRTVALITNVASAPSPSLVWLSPMYKNAYSTVVLPADDLDDDEIVGKGGNLNYDGINGERGDQELDTVPTSSEESILQDIIFDQGDDNLDSTVAGVSQLYDVQFTTALPVSLCRYFLLSVFFTNNFRLTSNSTSGC